MTEDADGRIHVSTVRAVYNDGRSELLVEWCDTHVAPLSTCRLAEADRTLRQLVPGYEGSYTEISAKSVFETQRKLNESAKEMERVRKRSGLA